MTLLDTYRPVVPRLDLGSGPSPREGYVGVDRGHHPGVLPWDFASHRQWPWEDESIEALSSSHLIEHLPQLTATGRDVLIHFFEQAWRVCQPGALFHLRWPVPFHPVSGMPLPSAWWDPTHYRVIPFQQIVSYFSSSGRAGMGVESYGIRCNWVPTRDIGMRALTTDDQVFEYDAELRRDPL